MCFRIPRILFRISFSCAGDCSQEPRSRQREHLGTGSALFTTSAALQPAHKRGWQCLFFGGLCFTALGTPDTPNVAQAIFALVDLCVTQVSCEGRGITIQTQNCPPSPPTRRHTMAP